MIISDPKNGTVDDWDLCDDNCFCHHPVNNSGLCCNRDKGSSDESTSLILSKFLR